MWKGLTPCLIATPTTGIYFYTHDWMKKRLNITDQSETSLIHILKQMVAGGISGIACWLLAYPLDVIKTKI